MGRNPDVLANSWGYLEEPDFKAEMDKLGIIPDSMKKKTLNPSCQTGCILSAENSQYRPRVYPGDGIGQIESIN